MNQPPSLATTIAPLLTMFIVMIPLAIMIYFIAERKGRSPAVALLGLIPLVNMLYALWLCSLTDVSVLREIESLKQKPSA